MGPSAVPNICLRDFLLYFHASVLFQVELAHTFIALVVHIFLRCQMLSLCAPAQPLGAQVCAVCLSTSAQLFWVGCLCLIASLHCCLPLQANSGRKKEKETRQALLLLLSERYSDLTHLTQLFRGK